MSPSASIWHFHRSAASSLLGHPEFADYLTSNQGVDLGSLTAAVRDKLGFRGLPFQGAAEAIARKETRLRALWTSRLGNQMAQLPPFDETFRVVRRALRQVDWP